MRIWIDVATPPQVLFFRPIIGELQQRGHEVLVTTRDFSQTVPLADMFGFSHTVIGWHGGRSLVGKGWAILRRTALLTALMRGRGIDLAVSHNSYAQALACPLLRLPLVTLMDYEGQPANHISFRLARRVVVPEVFPDEALRRYGASVDAVRRYNGLKEDLYLSDFVPDASFLQHLKLPRDKVLVTVRPPATMAIYHRFENPLFDQVLAHCLRSPEVCLLYLPRVRQQTEQLTNEQRDRIVVLENAVDGPNLIYHSDVLISAGGTMNREAAVLGTPAYSVFKGQLGAVDRHLIDVGRLTLIEEPAGIGKIQLKRKQRGSSPSLRPDLVREVVDMILGSDRTYAQAL